VDWSGCRQQDLGQRDPSRRVDRRLLVADQVGGEDGRCAPGPLVAGSDLVGVPLDGLYLLDATKTPTSVNGSGAVPLSCTLACQVASDCRSGCVGMAPRVVRCAATRPVAAARCPNRSPIRRRSRVCASADTIGSTDASTNMIMPLDQSG
jgi:hypothetical protein